MRSVMTDSTILCPNWTLPNTHGPQWLTGSSITSLLSAISCMAGSIISESMPKTIWAYLHHPSHRLGEWRKRRVRLCVAHKLFLCSIVSNNLKRWGHVFWQIITSFVEKFLVSLPTRKERDLQCAPSFIVPLKLHTAPQGYECYMSCAVKGNPRPRVTWYRNNISINTNTNYYISNTCGVCSMLLLRVGTKDMGEYTVIAENALGRAECSTVLSVRGERETFIQRQTALK